MSALPRSYRAGESLEDFCRACKTDRLHTVIAADADGRPIRVACGYCRSDHNYGGGPRVGPIAPTAPGIAAAEPHRTSPRDPFPIVSDRERIAPPMSAANVDLELLL